MAEEFPGKVFLETPETDEFIAHARQGNDDTVIVTVSTGVVKDTIALWQQAHELSEQTPEEYRLQIDDVDRAVDASLIWLILHELHHAQIGHLDLVGSAGISEIKQSPELGLTRQSKSRPSVLDGMKKDKVLAIQRCLELQADHDAQEIFWGHYSKKNWESIRFHASCVMAMMVLIDQQDQASDDERTHPTSAARIFQMFSVLAYLWMPRPNSDWDAPELEEIQGFYDAVVIPAVSDAIILAYAGGAKPVVETFERVDDLINDIRMLMEPSKFDFSQLQTAGAREYAELLSVNDKAIELLGPEKFSR